MKYLKNLVIGIAILCLILFYAGIIIPPFGMKMGEMVLAPFFKHVGEMVKKEELEYQEKIERGEDVPLRIGRDTCYQWEDTYEIGRYGYENEKVLEVHKGGDYAHLLRGIEDYAVYGNDGDDTLFIVSREGYAVIKENRKCRIYITAPSEDFEQEKEYGIDARGEKLYYTGKVENKYVTYLERFSEYSKEEQNILNKMIETCRKKKS